MAVNRTSTSRSKFTIESIIREKKLGPNGAILEAMDRLAEIGLPRFKNVDYVLFDTPGQLEPFPFRKAGKIMITRFEDRCCLFLGDLSTLKGNLLSFYLYALTVYYALETETVAALNKSDLLSREELRKFREFLNNPIKDVSFRQRGCLSYPLKPGWVLRISSKSSTRPNVHVGI